MSAGAHVLVTGGAGYVGSHACKRLAQAGYVPVVVDNMVYGHEWAVKWGPLERLDLADADALAVVFERYRPVGVLHFAAYSYVGESVERPLKYYRNIVGGSFALLEAMERFGVHALVFSSTCATYGIPSQVPIPEIHPQSPINPYGVGKLTVERMIADCGRAWGLRGCVLRYFNAAGADPDGEIGELHEPETHLIPLVLDVAIGRRKDIAVFGDDYPTPDGTCIRDYIHVADLADAHLLALEHLLRGGESLQLNLGNGNGYSVREVIAAAEKVTRRSIPFRIESRRAGDPPVLVGDAGQARCVLGWQPQRAALELQVADAWHWHQIRLAGR